MPHMPFLAPEGESLSELSEPDAEPDAFGRIDQPEPGVRVEEETLTIGGWVAFLSGPTARVEAWLGETRLGRARLGLPRPDVSEARDILGAAVSGFELTVDLSAISASDRTGEMRLRVVATAIDGQRHELDPVAFALSRSSRDPTSIENLRPLATSRRRAGGRRILVATHQLNLGGAQLYLIDLLSELLQQGAIEPTVVSAFDGSLREDLEAMGIPVHICGPMPIDDLSAHLGRVEELTAWAAPYDFELALINTATTLASAGAEVATRLDIPAVWAIHESFSPAIAWADLDPGVRECTEQALSEATFAIFEAEATQQLYEPLIDTSRCLTLPYGLAPIDRDRFDAAAARRAAGIPTGAQVLLCVGTVEARKAQVPLAQAFEMVADRHPDAHLAFVGGNEHLYSEVLEDYIAVSAFRQRMRIVPVTPDVQPWYALADVLVCPSDVESLPRSVLEAMAWETPVLATSVFGLPELIEHGRTGWLCEPRDISRLAEALDEVLGTPAQTRKEIGKRARALVERRHSLPDYASEVSKLLKAAISDHADGARAKTMAR